MNIQRMTGEMDTNRVAKRTDPIGATARPQPAARPRTGTDQADTSTLSRMASDSARKLSSQLSVRADKVSMFKSFANDQTTISDSTVDTILRKVMG